MTDELKPTDWAEEQALFRLKVIGSLLCGDAMSHGELAAALRDLSQMRFMPPRAAVSRTYGVSTLERWYYAYKGGGLGALRPHRRSDRGYGRALTDAQRELLLDIRRCHPRVSVAVIVRTLQADGRLAERAVSLVYVVFRAAEDATTTTVLIRLLQRELERWRREQLESDDSTGGATPSPAPVGRRDSLEINWTLVLIVVIVLIIIVLVLIAFGGPAAAVLAAIAAALAALGGSPAVVPMTPPTDDFGDGLAAVWSLAAGLMDVRLTPERADQQSEPPVQVKFAGMKIDGLPRDRVAPMFDFLGAALPGARWIFQHYLRRELDPRRSGSQAVS